MSNRMCGNPNHRVPCDCDREVPAPKPVTLQSIVQTNFGTLCLSTHGELYELRYHTVGSANPNAGYVLKRISFTVES